MNVWSRNVHKRCAEVGKAVVYVLCVHSKDSQTNPGPSEASDGSNKWRNSSQKSTDGWWQPAQYRVYVETRRRGISFQPASFPTNLIRNFSSQTAKKSGHQGSNHDTRTFSAPTFKQINNSNNKHSIFKQLQSYGRKLLSLSTQKTQKTMRETEADNGQTGGNTTPAGFNVSIFIRLTVPTDSEWCTLLNCLVQKTLRVFPRIRMGSLVSSWFDDWLLLPPLAASSKISHDFALWHNKAASSKNSQNGILYSVHRD
jgi:hypothetical protein